MQHHGAALRLVSRDSELAGAIEEDWRSAPVAARLRAILVYAEKLTLSPSEMVEEDLGPLRREGLDDRAILDVVQVTAYYNFVNRLADGLGVELER